MNKLKTAIVTLVLLHSTMAVLAQQTLPDRKTTTEYIKKMFDDAYAFEYITEKGLSVKIQGIGFGYYGGFVISHSISIGDETTELSYGFFQGYNKLSSANKFSKIDWAKMQNIEDFTSEKASDNSAVKLLYISFTPGSVQFARYNQQYDSDGIYRGLFNNTDSSEGFILFPYKNEPGVKERLVKALRHLSKLDKEARAKNDPFGN